MKLITTLLALFVFLASLAAAEPITRLDGKLFIQYLSWKGKGKIEAGKLIIQAPDGKGGVGDPTTADFSTLADKTPVLTLTPGAGNKAKLLHLMLVDETGAQGIYQYALSKAKAGESIGLEPVEGAFLNEPNRREKGTLDLAKIREWHIQGDWQGAPVDLTVEAIEIKDPSPEALVAREAMTTKLAAAAEAARKAKERAIAAIKHTPDSPKIERIYTVAPDMLAIEIVDGERRQFPQQPYVAQEGDEIKYGKDQALVIDNGEMKMQGVDRELLRIVDGKKQLAGYIIGGREGAVNFQPAEKRVGDLLEVRTLDDVESYLVDGKPPLAVYRKTKPTDRLQPNSEKIFMHTLYLELPAPLQDGQIVNIEFPRVNVSEPATKFTHEPSKTWTDAIHTTLIGYRPDDPFKRAYLSLWLGTGKGFDYEDVTTFELLNAETGEKVFEGKVTKLLDKEGAEKMRLEKNYSHTSVYGLDFSSFDKPGRYLVHVPGIGVSHPIEIRRDVWTQAFEKSMKGLLHNRSGIHLKKPWSEYDRPRDFHPDDGRTVFQSKVGFEDAAKYSPGNNWFKVLMDKRTDEVVPNAWGGYHDAGDFDRYARHIIAPYLNLEVFDLFPEYFATVKLSLPPDEAGDKIPDVLNEALWGLDVWKRIQREDGGVRTGIESSAHPRPAEKSWEDSLVLMAYEPEPLGTALYAATAARMARLLAPYDPAQAKSYGESAAKAFDWAESNYDSYAKSNKNFEAAFAADQRKCRSMAAVELYWLTGEDKYNQAFLDASGLGCGKIGDAAENQAALFAYARLPENLGSPALKEKAKIYITQVADRALKFADGNAFGITTPIGSLPEMGALGYFSVPEMITQSLPRAHFLTDDEKYLAGAVRAANFSAGANPSNMTFTTGVGAKRPEHPLHIDSRWTQQPAPTGFTIYGPTDPARGDKFNEWVHTYFLKEMVPNSRTWPATECHVDDFMWPMMNEFTIWQGVAPTAYYWGYLAGRPQIATP